MTAFGWIAFLAIVAAIVDMVRRPGSDWAAADRNRGFWIVMAVIPVAGALGYALFVLPRFAGARSAVDAEFRSDS